MYSIEGARIHIINREHIATCKRENKAELVDKMCHVWW